MSAPMSDKLRYAVQRFPDLAQAIKQYSADSRFFRGLCEDYGEAIEVLSQWERLHGRTASERATACQELIAELEQEILRELQRWNDG